MTGAPAIYESLYARIEARDRFDWAEQLRWLVPSEFASARHGKMTEWQAALEALPDVTPTRVELQERVVVGRPEDLSGFDRNELIKLLKTFHPWRKGPFELFGVAIDTEWRSDWKWNRLRPHIAPLAGRAVLDVGCGNGYHGWRMRGEGADLVVGIDPVMLYVLQHQVLQHYLGDERHHVLPLKMEDLPKDLACFDTVFSMGVLYHRRAPVDHLFELKDALRPGGELVLETLVVEGDVQTVFMPPGRYASMRNVWCIPSVEALSVWLRRCGFENVRCVDVNRTGTDEQRRTDWMIDESLADFLDPIDLLKTKEGHPAPLRAIMLATKP